MSTDIEEPNWLDDDEDLSGEELAYYERALRENRGRIVTRIRNARAALHDVDDAARLTLAVEGGVETEQLVEDLHGQLPRDALAQRQAKK